MGKRRELALFKAGYVQSAANGRGQPRMTMRKQMPLAEDRFVAYNFHLYAGCTGGDEVLLPLYKAILEEARTLATTKRQQELVIAFKYHVDRAELGEAAAQRLSAEARQRLRVAEDKAR